MDYRQGYGQGYGQGHPPQPHGYPAPQYWAPQQLPHSGLGVTSFVLALLSGLSTFVLLVVAGVMEGNSPGGIDETAPEAIALGLGIILASLAALLGLVLAIAGLIQGNRKKVFAVLGLTFNGLIVLGVAGIMALGLMMQ